MSPDPKFRNITLVLSLFANAAGAFACGGTGGNEPAPTGDQSVNDDERGSTGPPAGYLDYCMARGGAFDEPSGCRFADGTRCEQIAFYLGECGQSHSYCAEKGGVLTSETRDMGTWRGQIPICTLDGHTCIEQEFMRSGVCEE